MKRYYYYYYWKVILLLLSCVAARINAQTPSAKPSKAPSKAPSRRPSKQPSKLPTRKPSAIPSFIPTSSPSEAPVPCVTVPRKPCAFLALVMDESYSMSLEQDTMRSIMDQVDQALPDNFLFICSFAFGLSSKDTTSNDVSQNNNTTLNRRRLNTTPSINGCSLGFDAADYIFEQTGSTEDGWEAIVFAHNHFLNQTSIDGVSFQQCKSSRKIMFLVTDEDRDNRLPSLTLSTTSSILISGNWTLTAVINQQLNPFSAIGATVNDDSSFTYVQPTGSGTSYNKTHTTTNPFSSGFGSTKEDYLALVENAGGSAWNINKLRNGDNSFVAALLDNTLNAIVETRVGVTGFVLIDTRDNSTIGPLTNGQIISLETLDNDVGLTIQAVTSGNVGQVQFSLQSPNGTSVYLERIDNSTPYYLADGPVDQLKQMNPYQLVAVDTTSGVPMTRVNFFVRDKIKDISETNFGTDFWIAELPNLDCSAFFAISVANPNDAVASVVISHAASISNVTLDISPGNLQTAEFPCRATYLVGTTTLTLPVYRVTSNIGVIVYTFIPLENAFLSNDAALILPAGALGTSYRVASYRSPTFNYDQSMFGVVATQNNTAVQSFDRDGNRLDDMLINQGELFQRLQDDVMTAYKIKSDKPVALFSGNVCTAVGNSSSKCDILYEQIIPEQALASTYIGCPYLTRPIDCTGTDCAPDLFQIMTTEDSTEVSFTNGVQPTVTLNAGDFIEFQTNIPHVIAANKPIYVHQLLLSGGSGFPIPETGDPSLSAVPNVDQFQLRYIFLSPDTYAYDFINVVAVEGTRITLDGGSLPIISCSDSPAGDVNGQTYCCKGYPVSDGIHTIVGDQPFGLTVSGFDDQVSYAYIGGVGLQQINAGCNTGGPYQFVACEFPIQSTISGSTSCSDGSTTPTITWSTPDRILSFNNLTTNKPVVTATAYGSSRVCLDVQCGVNDAVQCCSTVDIIPPRTCCP